MISLDGVDPRLLTILGLALAAVVAFLGYRNNFGWKPLVLITQHGRSGGGSEGPRATLAFEVWNRQKYPIIVREIVVRLIGYEVDDDRLDQSSETDWREGQGGAAVKRDPQSLEANARAAHAVSLPFNAPPGSRGIPDVRVTALCYDPRRNKHFEVTARTSSMDRPSEVHFGGEPSG